jgi:cobalt-zinc-cadmium resistance protein CzcA
VAVNGMIEKIVRLSLQQRLLVFVLASTLFVAGLFATKRLSVDAFPEVTNIQVQIAAEAPSRSPEEVERFVTIPIELGMAGLPGLTEMRSLNRNGIAIITLVFNDKTEIYFARQLVTERLIEVASKMPLGVTPVLAPPSTGLGEVFQYTLDHPSDRNRALTIDELTERRAVQD